MLCINELVDRCLRDTKTNPRYAYFAPFYAQAKKVAWDMLKLYTKNIPGVKFNESELRADLPGGRRIYIAGADNPDAHRGIYLDGVILDEVAQMHPNIWSEVVRPALSDRMGWCIFIGTPKGRNFFYEMYEMARNTPSWYTKVFKASETGIIPKDELDQLRKEMGEDAFNQELECSWDAVNSGSYYGTQINDLYAKNRIVSVPYDPSLGVVTAWDLGIGDSTAIWFAQQLYKETRLIDYMEINGKGIPDIVRELKAKPYLYTTHLLPHDVAARELGTGKSRQEVFQSLGIQVDIIPRQKVEDGIQAARNLLPLCWFDAVKCHRGLEALKEYSREWDDKAQVFKQKPKHNWACFAPETEVLTRNGRYQIKDLPKQGEVLTPCGWKEYRNPRATHNNAPLVEVEFEGGFTVRCTPEHLFWTVNGWKSAEHLCPNTLIQSSLTPLRSILMEAYIVYIQKKDILRREALRFIGQLGRSRLEKYHKAAISITKTVIRRTTKLKTLSAFQQKSIFKKHGKMVQSQSSNQKNTFLSLQEKRPLSGTNPRPDDCGTAEWQQEQSLGLNGKGFLETARLVLQKSCFLLGKTENSKNTVAKYAKPLRIIGVKKLNQKSEVWCLTVPDGAWFTLVNGAVVHNSHGSDSFRMLALGIQLERPLVQPARPSYAEMDYNEFGGDYR